MIKYNYYMYIKYIIMINKTLISFGIVILIIGIIIPIYLRTIQEQGSLERYKLPEPYEEDENFGRIETFNILDDIAKAYESFWVTEKKRAKKAEGKAKDATKKAEKKAEKDTKKAVVAAKKANVITKSVSKVTGKSLKKKAIKATKKSEKNRKISKKTCMKSILDYANRLVDEAKVAQKRSAKILAFANEINKNL